MIEEEDSSAIVPAISIPHSVTSLRSLSRQGVNTIAVCEVETAAFCSRHCDEKRRVPAPGDDLIGYKNALLSLAERADVGAIVPMREEDIYVLSKYRAEFANELAPLWPRFDTLEVVHDRLRLVAAAEEAGVPAPETTTLADAGDWSARRVIKGRYGLLTDEHLDASGGCIRPSAVEFVQPGEEPDRAVIRSRLKHDPIVQEYVPGDEYAVWALYNDGEPVATCQKHQVRAENYYGGTSIYRKTTRIPELEAAGQALLNHLDWHGLASVQFKRDADTGEFKLMEINPRAWASISCPVRAGLDVPYLYWCVATGETIPEGMEYKEGVGTHYVTGEMKYLLSIARKDHPFVDPPLFRTALWNVASSMVTQPYFEYLSPRDPFPFVCELGSTLGTRISNRTVSSVRNSTVEEP